MAISLVGTPTEQQTGAAATALTLNTVSGIQPGDLLLYVLTGNTGTLSAPATIAGWQVWQAWTTVGTTVQLGILVWFRIADGTEAASYSAGTLVSARWAAQMRAYRGVDQVTPKDAANPAVGSSTTAQAAHNAITTVTANAWVLGFEAANAASGITTTTYSSTNLGNIADNSSTSGTTVNAALGSGDMLQASPGAVTPVLTPTGTIARGLAVTSALRPAAAAADTTAPAARRVNRQGGSRRRVATGDVFRGVYTTEFPQRQPIPVRAYLRGPRRVMPRVSGNFVAPPPPTQPPPPVFIPGRHRERVRLAAYSKSRLEFVPIPLTAVPPPAFVPGVQGRDRILRGWLARKTRRIAAFPSTDGPSMSSTRPRRVAWTRRAHRSDVPPAPPAAPVNPPIVFTATARRVLRGWLARRADRVEVVPAQVTATAPTLVPRATGRRTIRGWSVRRADHVEVVPPQAAPAVPAFVPRATGRRAVRTLARRLRDVPQTVADTQPTPAVARAPARRTRIVWRRLTRPSQPVPPQAAAPPPPKLVPQASQRRTIRGWIHRAGGRLWQPIRTVIVGPTIGSPGRATTTHARVGRVDTDAERMTTSHDRTARIEVSDE